MVWNKLRIVNNVLIIAVFCPGCAMYSFSGSSLSPAVKTFSIQDFKSQVALGPPDLAQEFTQRLGDELIQKTRLKQLDANGDIQFEGTVTQFKYTPIMPNDEGAKMGRIKLTIAVELSYIVDDEAFQFNKKVFEQSEDMDAMLSMYAEEPKLVEAILDKLIKDIFNASVGNW